MHEATIVVVFDEFGNYAVGVDQEAALTAFNEDVGGDIGRIVNVKLNVDLAPTLVKATVPAAAQPSVAVSV